MPEFPPRGLNDRQTREDSTYMIFPRTSPDWKGSLDVVEFNLDKARQLLAEAGYASGFETQRRVPNDTAESVWLA